MLSKNYDEDIELVLNLSPRIVKILIWNSITSIRDLNKIKDEKTLSRFKGLGHRYIKELKEEYKRVLNKDLFEYDVEKKRKLKRILSNNKIKRILEIKKLYSQLGTFQKVANKLGITRERVRQLLKKGEKFSLFKHQTTSTIKFLQLTNKVSKENIIQEIEGNKTILEICTFFRIKMSQYFKLINFYNIDAIDHRLNVKRKKYITKYMAVVNFLGHHPSATDLSIKKTWRNVWCGIIRYWGSIEKFREEYGIDKPSYNHTSKYLADMEKTKS